MADWNERFTHARVHETFQVKDREKGPAQSKSYEVWTVKSQALEKGRLDTWDKGQAHRVAKQASMIPPDQAASVWRDAGTDQERVHKIFTQGRANPDHGGRSR